MARHLGTRYEVLAQGREPRIFLDPYRAGAAFFDAQCEEMPQVVRHDVFSSEQDGKPNVTQEVIASTQHDPATQALVHTLRGVPDEFRAGYTEAVQRRPDRAIALHEQTPAVVAPMPVQMQLGEHFELQTAGHVALTYTNARQAGAAFHAARIEDSPKLIHHEPGQEPRTAAYTSPMVGALTEHGLAEFPNKVLANDLPIDADMRAGYYCAVEQSVVAGLAVTDWEKATNLEPWTVPRLEQRLYADLQTLAMNHRELAVQAWLDHAPEWAQKPTFVDLSTGQVATLDKVADLSVAKKVQQYVYAGLKPIPEVTAAQEPAEAAQPVTQPAARPAHGDTAPSTQGPAMGESQTTAAVQASQAKAPRVQSGPGSDSFASQHALAARDLADRHGLTAEIEKRFAECGTASKVRKAMGTALDFLPVKERGDFLVSVRASLGIPSQASERGRREFAAWKAEYDQRASAASITQPASEGPTVSEQQTSAGVQPGQPETNGLTNTIERAAPSVRLTIEGQEVDKLQFTKFNDHQGRRIDIEAFGDDGRRVAGRENLSPHELEQLVGKEIARAVLTSKLDGGLLPRESLVVQPGRQQAQVPDQPPAQVGVVENNHVGRLTLNNRAVEKLSFSKTRRPEGTLTDVRALDGEGKVITVAKALTQEALTQMVGQEIAQAIRSAKGRGGTLTGTQLPAKTVQQPSPVQAQAPTQEAAQTQAAARAPAEPTQPTAQPAQTQASTPAPAIDPAREAADKRAQELKRTLSDRFTIKGEKYLFKADPRRVAFIDTGLKLAAEGDTGFVVRGMVDLAEAKGWQALNVRGTEDFRRQAWLEGSVRGLEVRGYSPTPEDRQRLAERQQQLRNGIEPAQPQPPHGGQQPQPPAQAAQQQARDGAPSATRQQHLDVMREILNAQNVPPVKAEVILRKMGEKMDAMQAQGQPLPPIKVFDPQAAPRMAPVVVQPVPHHAPTRGVAR